MSENNNQVKTLPIKKHRSTRRNNIIQLVASLIIVIAMNIISSFVFTRFDLTAEKRYSISKATKKMISELDDIVFVQVYLDGEFPAGFKRLRNATRELLDEFRAYSKNIQYEFINPSDKANGANVEETYKLLVEKGLQPTNVQFRSDNANSQQIIFPGAIVKYKGRERPVQLLKDQLGLGAESVINNSIQSLEFNLATAINSLTQVAKHRIAFLEGNGELNENEVADISIELSQFYHVLRIPINHKLNSLDGIKTLIIAKPQNYFDEKDKFIIDQYVMNGGKVLWLIDPVFASMDSLQTSNETLGVSFSLNIDDMLFKYGVRLNPNLLMDLKAAPIPITTGYVGNRPQMSLLPWYFFPMVSPVSSHPIVKNLNALKTEFVSSIDTIKVDGVKKTYLLHTSDYTRVVRTPARISLDIMQSPPDEKLYNQKSVPFAVLLEGTFESLFANRMASEIVESKEIGFKDVSKPTQMIVVADGDIIKNQIGQGGRPMPLGYDRYSGQSFGNKDFILNAVNYLTDDSGLLEARSKEIQLRLLDKTKVDKLRIGIQIANLLLPVLLVIVFGLIQFFQRKRRYAS